MSAEVWVRLTLFGSQFQRQSISQHYVVSVYITECGFKVEQAISAGGFKVE